MPDAVVIVDRGGALIAGFQLDRGYAISAYDSDCAAAGLTLRDRFSTWNADPYRPGDDYAVSIHRSEYR